MELSDDVECAVEKMDWVDMVYTLKGVMDELLGGSLDSMPPLPVPTQPPRSPQPVCHQSGGRDEWTNMVAAPHALEQQPPLMAAPSSSQPAQLCSGTGMLSQGQTDMIEPQLQHKAEMNLPETKRHTALRPPFCFEQHVNLLKTETQVSTPGPSTSFKPAYYMNLTQRPQRQSLLVNFQEMKRDRQRCSLHSQSVSLPHAETQVASEPSALPEPAYYESGRYDEWMRAQLGCLTGAFHQEQNLMDQCTVKTSTSAAPVTPPAAPFTLSATGALAAPAYPRDHEPHGGTIGQTPLNLQAAGILNGQVLYAVVPAAPPSKTSYVRKDREVEDNKPYIKKPLNAYMLFLKEQRANVKAEFNMRSSRVINKIMAERWRSLSKEQLSKYFEEAKVIAQQHALQHPGWKTNYGTKTKRKQRRSTRASAFQKTITYPQGENLSVLHPERHPDSLACRRPPAMTEPHWRATSMDVPETKPFTTDTQAAPVNLPQISAPVVHVSVRRKVSSFPSSSSSSSSQVERPAATPQASAPTPSRPQVEAEDSEDEPRLSIVE